MTSRTPSGATILNVVTRIHAWRSVYVIDVKATVSTHGRYGDNTSVLGDDDFPRWATKQIDEVLIDVRGHLAHCAVDLRTLGS